MEAAAPSARTPHTPRSERRVLPHRTTPSSTRPRKASSARASDRWAHIRPPHDLRSPSLPCTPPPGQYKLGLPSPPPSTHSHSRSHSRSLRSVSSSLFAPLTPTRPRAKAAPTTAMSPASARSPSRSRSPTRAPLSPRLAPARPSSRSERLLRDTLLRADHAQDRHARSPRRRRPTSGASDNEDDEDDEPWMHRVRSRAGSVDRAPGSGVLQYQQRQVGPMPQTPTRRSSLQRSPASSPQMPMMVHSPPRSPLLRATTSPQGPQGHARRQSTEAVLRSRLENTLSRDRSRSTIDQPSTQVHPQLMRRRETTSSVGSPTQSEYPWSSSHSVSDRVPSRSRKR
jgi:hypothetical protein